VFLGIGKYQDRSSIWKGIDFATKFECQESTATSNSRSRLKGVLLRKSHIEFRVGPSGGEKNEIGGEEDDNPQSERPS